MISQHRTNHVGANYYYLVNIYVFTLISIWYPVNGINVHVEGFCCHKFRVIIMHSSSSLVVRRSPGHLSPRHWLHEGHLDNLVLVIGCTKVTWTT